jgi:ATP-dependent DNA ligase
MKYENYSYIYPPRPLNSIPSDELIYFDNNTLLCQCKLNGSNATIYTNGEKVIVMNRHNQRLTNFQINEAEIKAMYRGNGSWMVINGEYMNKSKSDEKRQVFNHKFVIFDILVLDNDYLVGSTFEQRVLLLDELYGNVPCEKDYLWKASENIYRVKSYTRDFLELYNSLVEIDMIEGLVLKRKGAKLERGNSESNNVRSQIKCRKPTRNYRY